MKIWEIWGKYEVVSFLCVTVFGERYFSFFSFREIRRAHKEKTVTKTKKGKTRLLIFSVIFPTYFFFVFLCLSRLRPPKVPLRGAKIGKLERRNQDVGNMADIFYFHSRSISFFVEPDTKGGEDVSVTKKTSE